MSLLNIGASGLRAYQSALNATGNNVTNANTPGYSRQRVDLENSATGSGVHITDIPRITSEQLLDQVRLDRSAAGASSALRTYLDQLDGVLSSTGTALGPPLSDFFNSLEVAATDPESSTARTLVLERADGLTRRFGDLQRRLDEVHTSVDSDIDLRVKEVNELLRGIGQLNLALTSRVSNPNAIYDQRDALAARLAEELSINVSFEGDQMTVLTAGGAPLVLTGIAGGTHQLGVTGVSGDRISVLGPGANIDITERLGGGRIGALVEFRDTTLALADNELGRVAVVLADQVNAQQAQGLTLDGEFGAPLFAFDERAGEPPRLVAHRGPGTPPDLQLQIADTGALRASSYTIAFDSGDADVFRVTRESDGAVVLNASLTGAYPLTARFDGLEVTFPAAGYSAGDRFELSAVSGRGGLLARGINNPEQLALASAVAVAPALTNAGNPDVLAVRALDATPLLALTSGDQPPLAVRFSSPTRYEILDASDPFDLRSLQPPLRGLPFVPGTPNELMPAAGSTGMFSSGPAVGQVAAPLVSAVPGAVANGYPGEMLAVNVRGSNGALLASSPVALPANASARDTAALLSAVDGVRADARTSVRLANLTDSGAGEPLAVFVNGQRFVSSGVALGADELVGAINSDETLAGAGISARIEAGDIVIEDAQGDDVSIALAGAAGDSVEVRGANSQTLTGQGAGAVHGVTVGGDVAVTLDAGVSLRPPAGSGLFTTLATSVDLGLSLTVAGEPLAGDTLALQLNTDRVGDNRNGLALAQLLSAATIEGRDSFGSSFQRMVGAVASRTLQSRIAAEADASILTAAENALGAVAGVNLDEEAADLVRFEQYYNASTQVISVGRSVFDALLGIFN